MRRVGVWVALLCSLIYCGLDMPSPQVILAVSTDLLEADSTALCAITYPFPANDITTYNRELFCDYHARLQPPHEVPAWAQRDPTLFPGPVPADAPRVARSFDFDLNQPDHNYLRIYQAPPNWLATGLYAAPGQIINVTLSNTTADDGSELYVRLGVHTNVLYPDAPNIQGGQFKRNPNITVRSKLWPGLNQVRNPYGGPIVLESINSLNKVVTVEIVNAVEAPHFFAGQTTADEWNMRRNAPAPFAILESDLTVLHVPTGEVNQLSYADVLATAQFYSQIGRLHNEFSGLSEGAALPHRSPQGKYHYVEDVQLTHGTAHASFPIMFHTWFQLGDPYVSVYRSNAWVAYHEMGHQYQMSAWSYAYGTEVTVNLWSLFAQEKLFGNSRLVDENRYAAAIELLNNPAIPDKWNSAGTWGQLVFLDQIRLAFPRLNHGLWTELMRRYREMPAQEYDALNNDQARRDMFLELLCDITATDLTPHFEAWTVAIAPPAKASCATKNPLAQPVWLLDGARPLYYAGAGSGAITRTWEMPNSRAALVRLAHNPAGPNEWTGYEQWTGGLELPANWGKRHNEQLRGYIHPPVTGAYHFWLAAGNAAQFRLSTDENPLNATPVITLAEASGYRRFDRFPTAVQRSFPIHLEAGRTYYFEAIHTDPGSRGTLSVAWTIPAHGAQPGEVRKIIADRYLSPIGQETITRRRFVSDQAEIRTPASIVFSLY